MSSHLEKVIVMFIALIFLSLGIYIAGWKAASDKQEAIATAHYIQVQKEHEKIKHKIMQKNESAVNRDLSQWMR